MLKLFQDEDYYRQYRYLAYITNLTLSAADVWRLYRGCGDAENRIKERLWNQSNQVNLPFKFSNA